MGAHGYSNEMIVVRFQQTFPLRTAEWLLAGVMITWSVIVLLNPTLFEDTPSMIGLLNTASQSVWGVWVLIIGLVRFAVLVINGAWRASPHIRAACAFVSCFVWLQICFGLAATQIPTTGLAIYPWFLLLDTYNVFRASSDARVADDRAKGIA